MSFDELMMQRCLDLAEQGRGLVAPNPMVGCVITHNDRIISESYHKEYGGLHAEPNAINLIDDLSILKECTLYVNLEPCAHHGKTPPCATAIAHYRFKKVVIGCTDTYGQVNGKGIEILKKAGVEVVVGVLDKKCREINRRFFTSIEKKRPYIILKWAQSLDGFIGQNETPNLRISNDLSRQVTHLWRSQEQAILIGTNTAIVDNPTLTMRLVKGKNPIRFVIDLKGKVPTTHQLMKDESLCYFFTTNSSSFKLNNKLALPIQDESHLMNEVIVHLNQLQIQSIIIEGGAKTLQSFIDKGYWDEARVFYSSLKIQHGVLAPILEEEILDSEMTINDSHSDDCLKVFHHAKQLFR
jgi:diaminohydroxyphosphoribosylaminopyrimidine deaminase/5-amino-6-(5-phosphoribosylamino)uracil reductase